MIYGRRAKIAGALMIALTLASPSLGQGQRISPEDDLATADTVGVAEPDAKVPTDSSETPSSESVAVGTTPMPSDAGTFRKDDLISQATGVFGKGAQGVGKLIEKILKDQGEPNAYIAGREAAGALVVGVRYGSGQMTHAVEGQRSVYWTGPSIGFDVGGDATKVFVLVYNLYDGQELFRRYPQVEGRAYYVGGMSATYLRRGNVAMIPIRLGVGLRLGANVGYMKFSQKSKLLPF